MNNYFYYSRNPYIQSIPQVFYGLNRQMIRPNIGSSFNFNSLLTSAQKGINTINQIIPLYKQVKPIYQQAKSSFSTIKKYIKFPINQPQVNKTYTYKSTNSNFNYHTNKGPSTPYFK